MFVDTRNLIPESSGVKFLVSTNILSLCELNFELALLKCDLAQQHVIFFSRLCVGLT